ncbi:hypothetical protein [Polymorphobacter multimanifer]|uniref:hypothetical protein n=1 Tax=Polymorphobacter multimanifer TaxID=1070431 RepID=UPI001A9C3AA9|nr:hypothetical protein [Polymorphobacter multimanifer]
MISRSQFGFKGVLPMIAANQLAFRLASIALFSALAWSAPAAARECTADDVPAAERKKLESAYAARRILHGRTKADAWAREEGIKSRASLTAAGGCGPGSNASASAAKPAGSKKKCRMVSRAISGPGGMTMAMVPKCD